MVFLGFGVWEAGGRDCWVLGLEGRGVTCDFLGGLGREAWAGN